MQVTLAKKEDIEAILALQTQIYRVEEIDSSAKDVLEKQLEDDSCNVLIAKDKDKVIGTATIYYLQVASRGKPYALLEGLVVDKSQRGKGYGTELFKKSTEIAKQNNCYKMIFTSGFDRDGAHKFYEKLGFKKWGFEFRKDL
jgi:GNAT superfamily N-acetyltransferase